MALHKLIPLILLLVAATAAADDPAAEAEIEYLIEAIGDSGCVFIRNGSRHPAADAEDHIRMKYKRARRYASTAELFIERLASKSSMSKKPYLMECPGAEPVPSGDWLRARLDEYREK